MNSQKLPFKGAFTATYNSKNLANVPYKRTNCLIKASKPVIGMGARPVFQLVQLEMGARDGGCVRETKSAGVGEGDRVGLRKGADGFGC